MTHITALASYYELAEKELANMTEPRGEMKKLAESLSTVERLMRDVR